MAYASQYADTDRSYAVGVKFRRHFFETSERSTQPTSRSLARKRCTVPGCSEPQIQELRAFEEVFLTSRKRLIAMAYAILHNKEDAEDAVQNAGISAFNNLRTFEGRSALKTWFTRIVLNSALMIRRKRKSNRDAPLPETGETGAIASTDELLASQPNPEMAYAEKEALERIDAVVAKMRPTLRQAFTMTYYDERSIHEASALLGISRGTFKSRLFRAREYVVRRMSPSAAARYGRRTPSEFSSPQTQNWRNLVCRSHALINH